VFLGAECGVSWMFSLALPTVTIRHKNINPLASWSTKCSAVFLN
jgi:hypothetical protein